jgi:hypothetical protein
VIEIKVTDNDDKRYIYESPDLGDTVYRREFDTTERELIQMPETNLFTYTAFREIRELAETNISLKKALDNLLLIYYTVKDDRKDST